MERKRSKEVHAVSQNMVADDVLLLQLDEAICSARLGGKEYLFQIYNQPAPFTSFASCMRIFRRNKYLMDICAVNGMLFHRHEEPNGLRLYALLSNDSMRSVLITPSLDEAAKKIRELPENFGFRFFLTAIERLE